MKTDPKEHSNSKLKSIVAITNSTIAIVILDLICIVGLIVDMITHHLVSNIIFWVLSIIEGYIGLLMTKYYGRFVKDKKYNRSNFWFLPLMLIGVGAPITIYLLLPTLGRIDAALLVFFITPLTMDLFKKFKYRKQRQNS